MLEDTMDGIFTRPQDWVRLANRIDKDGISEYLTWISKSNKLKIKHGYCTIVRESKWDNEATLVFDEPMKFVVGEFDGEEIIREFTKIKGEFSYEWFFLKNGAQDKIANGIEIYFNCKEFIK